MRSSVSQAALSRQSSVGPREAQSLPPCKTRAQQAGLFFLFVTEDKHNVCGTSFDMAIILRIVLRTHRLGRGSELHCQAPSVSSSRCGDNSTRRVSTQTLRQACFREKPESAMCVKSFCDSRGLAIRITYRISLRSSSLWEPRHPLLKIGRASCRKECRSRWSPYH